MAFVVPAVVMGFASAASMMYYSWSSVPVSATGVVSASSKEVESVDDFKDLVALNKIRPIPDNIKDELLSRPPVLRHVETRIAGIDTSSYMFERMKSDIVSQEVRYRLRRVKSVDKSNSIINELKLFRRSKLKPVGPIMRLATTTKRHPVLNEILKRKKYV